MSETATAATSFLDLIEARRDELIALTQDLIRIPTLNPPGEAYLEICEYLAARLKKRRFDIEMIRAHGTPGDSDRYPRWNVVARREGRAPGACVHFNSHIDVVETGHGWTVDPFGGELRDGRIYGRGACDMKGGLAASIVAVEAFIDACPDFHGAIEISGTADEETGGYGGVAYLAEKGFFRSEPCPACDHSRTTQQGSDLPWPSRCVVGRNRDQGPYRARLDAASGRLRRAPYGRGAAGVRNPSLSGAGQPAHGDAGGS